MKLSLLLLPTAALAAVLHRDILLNNAPVGAKVTDINYGGTGCPSSTPQTGDDIRPPLSSKPLDITLKTTTFTAAVSPTSALEDARRFCQITITISAPAGHQYQVAASRYTGALNLASGTTALQKALYYFSGETDQLSSDTEFKGPATSRYWIEDELPAKTSPWSPCGGSAGLNVKSEIRVDNPGNSKAVGQATGSVNGEILFSLDLRWRTC